MTASAKPANRAKRDTRPTETSESPARGAAISQAGERRSARVESLRALAALSVVLSHAYVAAHLAELNAGTPPTEGGPFARLVTGGRFGVFFFFALTAYLLYWPFAKSHLGGRGTVDLRRYAVNRALRILPLYFAVIAIVTVLLHSGATQALWLRDLTLTQNLSHVTASQVDSPIWSVIVEVHFYILLPVIAIVLAWIARGSARRALVAVLALGVVALAARYYLVQRSADPNTLWRLNLPGTFVFFIPGFLLALLRLRWEDRPAAWLRGPLGRADVWLLASVPVWLLVIETGFQQDLLVPLACFLMIGACVLPLGAGPLARSLQWRPLALVGIASYSLYLWHQPILIELHNAGVGGFAAIVALALPLTITVAFVSYAVVEAPFLRLRRQWSAAAAHQDMPTTVVGKAPGSAPEGVLPVPMARDDERISARPATEEMGLE